MAEYNRTWRKFSFIFNLSWLVTKNIIGGGGVQDHYNHRHSYSLTFKPCPSPTPSTPPPHKHTCCYLPYWLSPLVAWACSSTGLCNNASPSESSSYSIRFSPAFLWLPSCFRLIFYFTVDFFHFTTYKVGKKLTQTIPSRAWLGAGK